MTPDHTPNPTESTDHYRAILDELVDMGADLARQLHHHATTRAPDAPHQDHTQAFDRIARAIRRTIILARRIAAEPTPATQAQTRHAARKQIVRDVEDAIHRQTKGEKAVALERELQDRMDTPDLDEAVDIRPVAEIVADIVRDLGIAAIPGTHPWKRRTPTDIAQLCARAATRTRSAPEPAPHPTSFQTHRPRPKNPGGNSATILPYPKPS